MQRTQDKSWLILAVCALAGLLVSACVPPAATAAPASATATRPAAQAPDSVTAKDLVQPQELARWLAGPAAARPMVVHVGFPMLYHGAHIPGSPYAGPGAKPAGLDSLARVLAPVPRDRAVVLYCGCCPWKNCPNVRPAFRRARAMGFKSVKVLYVGQDFQKDWVARGFPYEKGSR